MLLREGVQDAENVGFDKDVVTVPGNDHEVVMLAVSESVEVFDLCWDAEML